MGHTEIADLRRLRHAARYDAWEDAQDSTGQMRCECVACGVHSFVRPGHRPDRECGNCGCTELAPLAEAAVSRAA